MTSPRVIDRKSPSLRAAEVSEESWFIAAAFLSVRNVKAVMKASLFSVYQRL